MAQIPLNPIKPLFFMVVSAPTENVICGSIDPAAWPKGSKGLVAHGAQEIDPPNAHPIPQRI